MHTLFKILSNKPGLYQPGDENMWDNPHISKGMLKAHLDETLDSATRNLNFVEKSAEWISTQFPPDEYPQLLDLGCGPGIYTELFYKKGYEVTGMDISQRSIQYAKRSAHEKNMQIEYMLEDYTKTTLPGKYNLITLIYCDFGVLSTETRKNLLGTIFDGLTANGVLLFDVFTSLKYQGLKEEKTWEISEHGFWDEDLCLSLTSFYRYDEDNTFLRQYTVVKSNETITNYNVWEHTFTFHELKDDLTQAGFKNIRFYGNVTGEKCRWSDQTICVAAEKE